MASAYHLVHYRLFKPQIKQPSLEKLCRSALNTTDKSLSLWQRASDRIFDLPTATNRKVVLNTVADLSSAVIGEMCLLQSDGFQALLELKTAQHKTSNITTAEIFSLEERSAPQNSQFIRGMIYWLAIGNHLFFVKTQSATAEHLKLYLEWLLKVRSTALPPDANVTLQAEFDRSQLGADIGEIRSLKVSGTAIPMSVQAAAQAKDGDKDVSTVERKTARRILDKLITFDQAVPVVEALLGQKKAKSLVDSLGPNEYLSVDASVKVRGRRTEQSREQMQELASELADITDGKVQVEGKDGKLSNDDAILRTSMPFDLPHEGSNFLDFDNVSDQLQEVYSRFVKDGKIDA
jgi:hypothetical protein